MSSIHNGAGSEGLSISRANITDIDNGRTAPALADYCDTAEGGDEPFQCIVCNLWCINADALLLHNHDYHNKPPSNECYCSRCLTAFDPSAIPAQQTTTITLPAIELERTQYTVPPECTPHDELAFVFEDADVWENNLPTFMSQIEPSTTKRTRAPLLYDTDNNPTLSTFTGRQLRSLSFLPSHIPSTVSPWRMLYWDRKASLLGIRLTNHDLVDRMTFPTQFPLTSSEADAKANMLSMRVQRYALNLGILPAFEKNKSAFPSEQGMRSLEGLYLLQGKLNTWWLPTHFGKKGPWGVVQPAVHPGYRFTDAAHSNYRGESYVIEKMGGLSERVREVADGLLFLEMKAEQIGITEKWELLRGFRLGGARRGGGEAWFLEEFERWREGGWEGEPTVEEIRRALENAPSREVRDAIMGGDLRLVRSLQGKRLVLDRDAEDDGKGSDDGHHSDDSAIGFGLSM